MCKKRMRFGKRSLFSKIFILLDSILSYKIYQRFHNDSRNMFVNTSDENWFFIFPIMLPEQLPKQVHMG